MPDLFVAVRFIALIRKTNIFRIPFLFIILFFFISQSFIFSEPAPSRFSIRDFQDSQSGNEIKTDYAFAEKLYSEENYTASLVELKRFLYYAAPDQDLRPPERLLIKCYAVLGEKSDLKKELKEYSALLPGSGSAYAGKFNKGLYSFLINASLIGATAYTLGVFPVSCG